MRSFALHQISLIEFRSFSDNDCRNLKWGSVIEQLREQMQRWRKLNPFHGNDNLFFSPSLFWPRIMQLCSCYLQRQGQLSVNVICNLKKLGAPSIGSKLLWRYMKLYYMLLDFFRVVCYESVIDGKQLD